MPDECDTMREMDALLRSTQILLMNLQTNTPAAVAISPLLVCFAQSNLPRASSDLVRNIMCLTSMAGYQSFAQGLTQGEQEVSALQQDNTNASGKVIPVKG